MGQGGKWAGISKGGFREAIGCPYSGMAIVSWKAQSLHIRPSVWPLARGVTVVDIKCVVSKECEHSLLPTTQHVIVAISKHRGRGSHRVPALALGSNEETALFHIAHVKSVGLFSLGVQPYRWESPERKDHFLATDSTECGVSLRILHTDLYRCVEKRSVKLFQETRELVRENPFREQFEVSSGCLGPVNSTTIQALHRTEKSPSSLRHHLRWVRTL